ncbi:MAG: hypothetical protein ACE5FI_06190 [Anaerolineales bacterium]
MAVEYDSKGKAYTKILTKDTVRARVQLPTHQIYGDVYLKRGERVKDEIEFAEQFLALTDVEVYDVDGEKSLFTTPFITINREQIIWLLLVDE